ncbi:Annexin [Mollisia scopiformis]|uniref:Annexin n=1 Tax=Mollisia scopiformis TaxID=149040 RepID=A0A194X2S7_MOLSC|nr:Annexin [Mollisia scopiformis]KUJ14485.1 Annexin [Mollisia scopiformis]
MSLNPNDDRRRGRSKSPGGGRRERSRSRVEIDEYEEKTTTRERSRVRVPSPPTSSRYDDDRRGYEYEERDTTTIRRGDREPAKIVTAEPRDPRGSSHSLVDPRGSDPRLIDPRGSDPRLVDPRSSRESYNQYRDASPPSASRGYAVPGAFKTTVEEEDVKVRYGGGRGGREKEYYESKKFSSKDDLAYGESPPRSKYQEVDQYKYTDSKRDDRDSRRYEDEHGRGASFSAHAGHHSISAGVNVGHGAPQYVQPPDPSAYQVPGGYQPQVAYPEPGRHYNDAPGSKYAETPKWEYAKPEEKITYSKVQETTYGRPGEYGSRHGDPRYDSKTKTETISYEDSQYRDDRHDPRYDSKIRKESVTYEDSKYKEDSKLRTSKTQTISVEPGSRRREPSPNPGLAPRMHSLSVSTGHHGGAALSLAAAPGSPLLEAYHGTYQSISPMPSPLMIPSHSHTDINLIEPLSPSGGSSDDDRFPSKKKRTARFHDPVDEATILAKALKGEKRAPDTQPLIEILPGLTHEQVLDLRVEYKRIVKTGSEKKGVNIAKHIKMRLKEEDPNLMKACYACALGKWESEAYWANFWYQGEKSRRELLIESLMGRTNAEIREIKDGFSDKKYSDSLTKCMKTELKEDKFKKAVLLVLEERKMEERPGYAVDRGLVEDDVHDLYKAVRSEKGGETAMINIVVVRSDAHLREVLREYEVTYRANFAREMLKKSGNLVGEMLAHILNGVINKPVRDALLVHHALSLSKSDSIRTELLISRLVRYHWDRPHMEAVKREYRARYGVDMQKAVAEGTRGEWGHFCEMLCVRRMGDEVRRVERVEEYRVDIRSKCWYLFASLFTHYAHLAQIAHFAQNAHSKWSLTF